jgi:hypothetical protein
MKQTFSYALSEANVASDDGGSYAPPGSNEPPKQHVDPSTSSGSGGTYTAPAANNSNKNHENIDHAEIAHGTTAGNPLPQPSSGVNVGYKNETSGPRRPDYSSIPSERERIIHKELEQQDGTFGSKLSQVAERLARTGVERANAQERENERTSGDRSGSPLTLIQIKTPDLKLPSPYEPGPEPGFNSNGRAIAYAASNQANASAAAANLSGMAYTKPGVGTGSKAPNANGKENPAVNGQPDSGKNSSVGAAAGNRGLSAVTGGIGASAAASIAAKKEKKTFDLETRARKALLVFLQGPYKRVKSELERPAVRERLMHHKIQVIDDEKQVYGPQDFKDQLIYDASPKLQRLVIVKKPAREAAGR